MSTDLHCMAIVTGFPIFTLYLYDVSTGQYLTSRFKGTNWQAQFTLGGHKLWLYKSDSKVEGWSIVEDSESNILKLESIVIVVFDGYFSSFRNPPFYP
jgi:hypothetical protein